MKTIRGKLFVIFAVFLVLVVLSGNLLNALFLEKYFIYKSSQIFIVASEKIERIYIEDRKRLPEFINSFDRAENINCTIANRDMVAMFNSFPQNPGPDSARLPLELSDLIQQNERKLKTTYVCTVLNKPEDQAPKLVFLKVMGNGDILILKKTMTGITESVAIASRFYLYAGLLIMVVGGMLIAIFSKRITTPVVDMSDVAKAISNLDFDKRVELDSKDELGNLARSINLISEKLSASIDELKQDVERRKQLVRNITHELKSPIGVIKGYAEGLKYGVAEDPIKTQRYCTVISDECDRMEHMIHELLNLSLLESGMFKMSVAYFDVCTMLHQVLERFEPEFKDKGITFEWSCHPQLMLEADNELIHRAVTNYVLNAIHHVGGIRHIRITGEKKGDYIRISVFNSGMPIPLSDLDNIWDVFYKVNKARTREYGGHGLGLSIVKLIADVHGGFAGLENQQEGVLFYIEIPEHISL